MLLLTGCTLENVSPTRAVVTPTLPAAPISPVLTTVTQPPVVLALFPLTRTPTARCAGAPPTRLIVQTWGRITNNGQRLNLRVGAGTDYRVRQLLETNALVFVLEGPVCAEEFTWYQVQAGAAAGWIAEGDLTEYYVEPYLTD